MSLVGRFEHLPNRPKSNEARPLLEKIASQVKPIMAKRGWKVGVLAEFLPANPALLGNNMNAGQRINLRLRPPGDTDNFYEYDQLVLVMLHELTHIEHGPHDSAFYALLATLEEEYYTLKRKGYSGEGFHSDGHHLSGLKVNEYEGRKKGLDAAQKRLDVQKKIGKGGVLGGSSVKGKTIQQVVAEAAERRMRDDKACRTADPSEVEEEVRRAQQESVGVDARDLPGEADGSVRERSPSIEIIEQPPASRSIKQTVTPAASVTTKHPEVADGIANSSIRKVKPASAPKANGHPQPRPAGMKKQLSVSPATDWSCPTCTLLNPLSRPACDACSTPRPQVSGSDGWWCEFCTTGPIDMGLWSCVECGYVRKWG